MTDNPKPISVDFDSEDDYAHLRLERAGHHDQAAVLRPDSPRVNVYVLEENGTELIVEELKDIGGKIDRLGRALRERK